jgi:hypothetical protein
MTSALARRPSIVTAFKSRTRSSKVPDAQLLGDMLRVPRPEFDPDSDQGTREFYEYSILLAGLQKVASILKEQDIQQAHANAEFQNRVHMYLDLREQIRKKRCAEMRKLAKQSPIKKRR